MIGAAIAFLVPVVRSLFVVDPAESGHNEADGREDGLKLVRGQVTGEDRSIRVQEYERLLLELRQMKAKGQIDDLLTFNEVVSEFSRGLLKGLMDSENVVINLRDSPPRAAEDTAERTGTTATF
jgi:hypothetical protein